MRTGTPAPLVFGGNFENCCSHGEYAGISRRDDSYTGAVLRQVQRHRGAFGFDAVVAGMAPLARTRRHAIDVRAVADEVGCERKLMRHFRCGPGGVARPESDHDHLAAGFGCRSRVVRRARNDGDREVRNSVRVDLGSGFDALTCGARALDVVRFIQAAGILERLQDRRERASELEDGSGVGFLEPPGQLSLRQCSG